MITIDKNALKVSFQDCPLLIMFLPPPPQGTIIRILLPMTTELLTRRQFVTDLVQAVSCCVYVKQKNDIVDVPIETF